MEAGEAEPRCRGRGWYDAREYRAGRGRSVLASDRHRPARRHVSARSGAVPVHPEGRWEAAATGHPDRAGSRGAGGNATGAGADLRGGLPFVLVRLSAEAWSHRCTGGSAVTGQPARNHVLDADIRDYFGTIDHGKLMKLVA